MYILPYRTGQVLDLAAHALAAPAHIDADGFLRADAAPALHFVADQCDGVYLASSGCAKDAEPGEYLGHRRVAAPVDYGTYADWSDWIDAVLSQPSLRWGFPLLDGCGGLTLLARTICHLDRDRVPRLKVAIVDAIATAGPIPGR